VFYVLKHGRIDLRHAQGWLHTSLSTWSPDHPWLCDCLLRSTFAAITNDGTGGIVLLHHRDIEKIIAFGLEEHRCDLFGKSVASLRQAVSEPCLPNVRSSTVQYGLGLHLEG
jgi:hypothetical protein